MPEDVPFSYDPAKFESLLNNLLGAFGDYREDATIALGKMTDMNKEIASFNEKLMLLSLGTIGISVSALISFVSKFTLAGWHRTGVIFLGSVAWITLFVSAMMFRSVVTDCMAANRKLLYEWISTTTDLHGAAIKFHGERMGTAFTGSTIHEGAPYNPKSVFGQLGEETTKLFQSAEVLHFKNVLAKLKLDPIQTGRISKNAVILLQFALFLLAITAIILFNAI